MSPENEMKLTGFVDRFIRNVDLEELPGLPVELKWKLPSDTSAVYFLMDHPPGWAFDRVLYVGKSVNISKRWYDHGRFDDAVRLGNVMLHWLATPHELLEFVEFIAIRAIIPEWNPPPMTDGWVVIKGNPSRKLKNVPVRVVEDWVRTARRELKNRAVLNRTPPFEIIGGLIRPHHPEMWR